MQVPFLKLNFDTVLNKKLSQKVSAVIEGGHYILGPEVKLFEKSFAQFCDTPFCLGVSNGLDALVIALRALEIKPGDNVVVPSHTFIATWLAVSQLGAEILPVDIDDKTAQMDANLLEEALKKKSNIKAVILVHLYGNLGEISKIQALCKKYNVALIEDSAQAHGSQCELGKAGTFGDIATFSFYPGKNLGAIGDAGAITTSDENLFEKCVLLRNYGSKKKYYHEVAGGNQRLDEVQAAVLVEKLKHLSVWNSIRQDQVKLYEQAFSSLPEIQLVTSLSNASIAWHLFVIRIKEREQLQTYLAKEGIETIIHYPIPCHLSEAYKNLKYERGSFPVAEKFSETCLSLPIGPHLQASDIQWVCDKVREYFQ